MDAPRSPLGVMSMYGIQGGGVARDRFNLLNKYSTFRFIDASDPVPVASDAKFSDIVNARAAEFAGKQVLVAWSGGVDSTVVLLSLLENGVDPKDMEVVYSGDSMLEYPALYRHLRGTVSMRRVSDTRSGWRDALTGSGAECIVSGQCGDSIYTSSWFFLNDPTCSMVNLPVETFLAANEYSFGELSADDAMAFADEYREGANRLFGIQLKTAAEFVWYAGFCMGYASKRNGFAGLLAGTPAASKCVAFFATPKFESWSVGQFPTIRTRFANGFSPLEYKREYKEYCNALFPDWQYMVKGKVGSWRKKDMEFLPDGKRRFVIKLDDGTKIYDVPADKFSDDAFMSEFVAPYRI
jgi:hypothetical protein